MGEESKETRGMTVDKVKRVHRVSRWYDLEFFSKKKLKYFNFF